MTIDLEGKTALITGGTSGIGLAAAFSLGGAGAKIAVCGTNRLKLDNALAGLREKNIRSAGKVCDAGDSAALSAFADWAEKELGEVNIFVGNAGLYPQYTLLETPDNVWQKTVDVNMKAVLTAGKIAYRKMKPLGGGVLIIASSFAAEMPSVGSGLYAATKAAAASMIKTLAAELAPFGIRVCGYMPGVVDTGMTRPLIEASGGAMKDSVALHRYGAPSEVADLICFLASDSASYITGTVIDVSGGKFCVQNAAAAWQGK